ncbi:hypothetical protein Pan153_61970 [Gimesia panareensis]|uniref:Uncharacterized protein n=1 Tax=Gimesia panareensis TaxID=2527978 RepID=A0A518FYR0_9PLAN|nr:hypothetical protein [Gimesia panareensis]QDV21507.1 hypothetical protein Pan153_61970 [Gimesia panareensis]
MDTDKQARTSLLTEFRLRRWARMHYVSSDQRKATWNPIVLDEMNMKDQEMHEAEENSMKARVSSMYVPLAPGRITRIDESHTEAAAPHILKMQERAAHNLQRTVDQLAGE